MGILIDYSTKSKACKIYDLKSNKVVIARDVKVAENGTWNWEAASIVGTKQEHQIELDAIEDDDTCCYPKFDPCFDNFLKK